MDLSRKNTPEKNVETPPVPPLPVGEGITAPAPVVPLATAGSMSLGVDMSGLDAPKNTFKTWTEADAALRDWAGALPIQYGSGGPRYEPRVVATTLDAWSGEGMGYHAVRRDAKDHRVDSTYFYVNPALTASNEQEGVGESLNGRQILEKGLNPEVLEEFYKSATSGAFDDGKFYNLYLDFQDNTIFMNVTTKDLEPFQREDNSLARLATYHSLGRPEARQYDYSSWEGGVEYMVALASAVWNAAERARSHKLEDQAREAGRDFAEERHALHNGDDVLPLPDLIERLESLSLPSDPDTSNCLGCAMEGFDAYWAQNRLDNLGPALAAAIETEGRTLWDAFNVGNKAYVCDRISEISGVEGLALTAQVAASAKNSRGDGLKDLEAALYSRDQCFRPGSVTMAANAWTKGNKEAFIETLESLQKANGNTVAARVLLGAIREMDRPSADAHAQAADRLRTMLAGNPRVLVGTVPGGASKADSSPSAIAKTLRDFIPQDRIEAFVQRLEDGE